MENKTTSNNVDISDHFEVTCKKCGGKDIEIYGYSMDGYDYADIKCNNPDCDNELIGTD